MTNIVLKINCSDFNPPVLAQNLPFLENFSGHPFSLKVAQNSFQHFPRRSVCWVIVTTLYQLILQIMASKNCPIIGEHVGIIFVTQ